MPWFLVQLDYYFISSVLLLKSWVTASSLCEHCCGHSVFIIIRQDFFSPAFSKKNIWIKFALARFDPVTYASECYRYWEVLVFWHAGVPGRAGQPVCEAPHHGSRSHLLPKRFPRQGRSSANIYKILFLTVSGSWFAVDGLVSGWRRLDRSTYCLIFWLYRVITWYGMHLKIDNYGNVAPVVHFFKFYTNIYF